MADGAQIIEGLFKSRPRPLDGPKANYLPAETPGAVYLGVVRFEPEQVEALIAFFQRHQAWGLHDALCAARDGLTPEPRPAA